MEYKPRSWMAATTHGAISRLLCPSAHSDRILVIDNDARNRRLLCLLLACADLPSDRAANVDAALRRIRKGPLPWLILFDPHLSRMTCEEFMQALAALQLPRRIPVILMSDNIHDRGIAVRNRLWDFVRKPLDAGKLLEIVAGVAARE